MRHSLRLSFVAAIMAFPWSIMAADPQQGEVTQLNGKKSFGLIEVTDDYTIRISSDSGIQNIPIASLSEVDFRKLGFSKDRSKDGRFWSERQGALKDPKNNTGAEKDENSGDIEIRLAEIAPFQPLIDAYQKTIPDKKEGPKADADSSTAAAGGTSPMGKLFDQSSMGKSPFSGGLSSPITEPLSAAGTVLSPMIPTPPLP